MNNQQVVDSNILQSVGTTNIVAPAAANSDSIFSFFWNAGLLFKLVIIILLCVSVYSWSIIIAKFLKIRKINKLADDFEEEFWSGVPIDVLYKRMKAMHYDPLANIFCAAMAEWEQSNSSTSIATLEKRIERAMQIAIKKELDDLDRGLTFLSTVGTNGVIVGLFGTVIGIIESSKKIASQQNANITVVAPVISEALFTAALGIFVALPAAVAYNKYIDDINKYVNRLEIFADEFCSIISRQANENQ